MSFAPEFLDTLRAALPLSDLVGRYVRWDEKRSNRTRGDYWAPCPFHSEKTASFHVDDQKGFYYCFGCHAKGDHISFLTNHARLGFVEAVEEIAKITGIEIPKNTQRSPRNLEKHGRLIEIHKKAAGFYVRHLHSKSGTLAHEYLKNTRQLGTDSIQKFELGFAPDARSALCVYLREQGATDEDIIAAGLGVRPDDGGAIYDRFRNRIMFPIYDAQNRIVAFGGRALDKTARAKYLNSPETEIFHKGHIVYNFQNAQKASRDDNPLILVEGYMDVIALDRAGLTAAVAPMGTALTETQLRLLWRINGMPIVALDGDEAGQRALNRTARLALPMIEADKTLRFVLLPAGKDPGDIIEAEGPAALKRTLADTQPLIDVLWSQACENIAFKTPEDRALLDRNLGLILKEISNSNLRTHYHAAFRERRAALFGTGQPAPRAYPGHQTHASAKKTNPPNFSKIDNLHHATILYVLLNSPDIIDEYGEELTQLSISNNALDNVRLDIFHHFGDLQALDDLRAQKTPWLLDAYPELGFLHLSDPKTDQKTLKAFLDETLRKPHNQQKITQETTRILAEMASEGESPERLAQLQNLKTRPISKNDGTTSDASSTDQPYKEYLRARLANKNWKK